MPLYSLAFSGGPDMAAEWMGWENVFHCEINQFGKQVLKYYWPNSISYDNIKTTDFTIHRGHIDVLTGGFPCQPYSQAGKRLGKEDDRHLWPEMLRAIREIKPRWVVGENVSGLITWSEGLVFDEVQADLEAEGYEVQAYVLPAVSVNAPHRRDRVWFVAYAESNGRRERDGQETDIQGREMAESGQAWDNLRDDIRTSIEAGGWTTPNTRLLRPQIGEQRTAGFEQCGETPKNTMHSGCLQREPKQEGTEVREQRNTCTGNTERICVSEGDIADTCNTRLQGMQFGQVPEPGHGRKQPHGPTSKLHKIPDWRNFPTQSPVRSRNDGISPGLVGITVPKHRNESIKAYGNAIVPQVIYQIFKSIADYESHP